MEGSSPLYVNTLPGLVVIGIVAVQIKIFDLSRDLTKLRPQRLA